MDKRAYSIGDVLDLEEKLTKKYGLVNPCTILLQDLGKDAAYDLIFSKTKAGNLVTTTIHHKELEDNVLSWKGRIEIKIGSLTN